MYRHALTATLAGLCGSVLREHRASVDVGEFRIRFGDMHSTLSLASTAYLPLYRFAMFHCHVVSEDDVALAVPWYRCLD